MTFVSLDEQNLHWLNTFVIPTLLTIALFVVSKKFNKQQGTMKTENIFSKAGLFLSSERTISYDGLFLLEKWVKLVKTSAQSCWSKYLK